jgi:hypothetical protein
MLRRKSWRKLRLVFTRGSRPCTLSCWQRTPKHRFSVRGDIGAESPISDRPDGEMYKVALSGERFESFVTEPSVEGEHIAFGVSEPEFTAIVERLRPRGTSFGRHIGSAWRRGRVFFGEVRTTICWT